MTGCRDDLSSFKMATEITINRNCCKSINTQENKACMQLTSSLKACSCAVFSESDSSSKFSSFIATSPCQLPLHKNHGCVKKKLFNVHVYTPKFCTQCTPTQLCKEMQQSNRQPNSLPPVLWPSYRSVLAGTSS